MQTAKSLLKSPSASLKRCPQAGKHAQKCCADKGHRARRFTIQAPNAVIGIGEAFATQNVDPVRKYDISGVPLLLQMMHSNMHKQQYSKWLRSI